MEITFGVKAGNSFGLYEAFKKEAEQCGWRYNHEFTKFEEKKMQSTNSFFFSSNWSEENDFKFAFSNTSNGNKIFHLPLDWNAAVEHIKKFGPNSKLDLALPETVEVSLLEIADWKNVDVENIRIKL